MILTQANLRIGLIARADNSGLGVQTYEFYRHIHPSKTMLVDISEYNGNKVFHERYPDATVIQGFPKNEDVNDFLQDLDVVFIAEAAYNPYLYTRAKELGVKTAVQYNYEFMDWLVNPDYPKPDMLVAPSKWNYGIVDEWCGVNNVRHVYLHCPVNRDLLPFQKKDTAQVFLHVAGRSAAHDRNGTYTVLRASKYLKSNAKILIHFQGEQGLPHQATETIDGYRNYLQEHGDPAKVELQIKDYENYNDIYQQGDVLLLPRRYGGNCLPMNEALSTGMPVLMSNISPNKYFLPQQWLLPAKKINEFSPRTTVSVYDVDPIELAKKIDAFAQLSSGGFKFENALAGKLAESISWRAMADQYRKVFTDLCNR